jgi:hypothetical protein
MSFSQLFYSLPSPPPTHPALLSSSSPASSPLEAAADGRTSSSGGWAVAGLLSLPPCRFDGECAAALDSGCWVPNGGAEQGGVVGGPARRRAAAPPLPSSPTPAGLVPVSTCAPQIERSSSGLLFWMQIERPLLRRSSHFRLQIERLLLQLRPAADLTISGLRALDGAPLAAELPRVTDTGEGSSPASPCDWRAWRSAGSSKLGGSSELLLVPAATAGRRAPAGEQKAMVIQHPSLPFRSDADELCTGCQSAASAPPLCFAPVRRGGGTGAAGKHQFRT